MTIADDSRAALIAVAPLRQQPADPDQGLRASAFLEDVIAELARFPGFGVLAARTTLALDPTELEPARIAQRFGATHLLDSRIYPQPDAMQIQANLIDTGSGRQLWGQRYSVALRDVEAVQEDLAAQVANHLCARIDNARLARARTRPIASLPAYDLWLRGRDCLKRGTVQADVEARELFTRALELDPTYARAYVGLSLTHFNEWSCQMWQDWEVNERLAFEYACRALELDEGDHVVHSVIGRIFTYRRNFARARAHLDRSMALSPNDADVLVQIAPWFAFAGEAERSIELVEKAFRLNPMHDVTYFVQGSLPYLLAGRLREGLAMVEKAPPNMIVDQSAFMAAAYAHIGELDLARKHVAMFRETFQEKITFGREPEPHEPLAYLIQVCPFSRPQDLDLLVTGLAKAGLDGTGRRSTEPYLPRQSTQAGRFALEGSDWVASYAGKTVRVPNAKGCRDIAMLLLSPGERIHCMEIAGRVREADAGPAMDARARAECQLRMRELREELESAEQDNDLARTSSLREELDQLIHALEAALGLSRRERKLGDSAERARSAVTSRIRGTMKRIGAVHPDLGRHLDASIRTGAFCTYDPEQRTTWIGGS
jgi:TolB-like protein